MTEMLNEKEIEVLRKIKNHVPKQGKDYTTFGRNNAAVKSLTERGLIFAQVNAENKLLLDVIFNSEKEEEIAKLLDNQVIEQVEQLEQQINYTKEVQKMTMNFEIEDGVALPVGHKKVWDFPILQMNVGQSFVVNYQLLGYDDATIATILANDEVAKDKCLRKTRLLVKTCRNARGVPHYKFKFAVEERGVRVWLVGTELKNVGDDDKGE